MIGNQHESMLMINSTPCNCVLNGRYNVLTGLFTHYLYIFIPLFPFGRFSCNKISFLLNYQIPFSLILFIIFSKFTFPFLFFKTVSRFYSERNGFEINIVAKQNIMMKYLPKLEPKSYLILRKNLLLRCSD